MRRRSQAGFTLIEVMVVVAIIAVLAAIAIPSFFKESTRAKGQSEVQPIFSDLRTRLDQYHQENGIYPPSIGETDIHPASPNNTKKSIQPLPVTWNPLKLRISGSDQVYCGYTYVTGLPSDTANVGTIGGAAAPNGFAFVPPATNWYYLLARCNFDGNASVDSYYFSSSVDPTLKKLREGS